VSYHTTNTQDGRYFTAKIHIIKTVKFKNVHLPFTNTVYVYIHAHTHTQTHTYINTHHIL